MGAWTYDAHVAFQHIKQLGNLVEAGLAEEAANAGNTFVIAGCGSMTSTVTLLDAHTAELPNPKHLIASADPHLPKKYWTWRVPFDQQRNGTKKRRK